MPESLALGLLGAWLVLSIVGQAQFGALGRLARALKDRDRFGVVPRWGFFAPDPPVTDLRLLYRDRSNRGALGPWIDVDLAPDRGWMAALWNPGKRREKVVIDCAVVLRRASTAGTTVDLRLTVPYLILLDRVCTSPGHAGVRARQFVMIEQTAEGDDRPAVALLSDWHRIRTHGGPGDP